MKTASATVQSVSIEGVTVIVDDRTEFISWHDLDRAARQDDRELATIYGDIRTEAHRRAADGPVRVEVRQDATHVWWVCCVSALYGGGSANYTRLADEGGTHPNCMLASSEAIDICERLGSRVHSRVGIDADAKSKIARIVNK